MTIFIPWEGGESPMPEFTHVHVQFRDPTYNEDGAVFWSHELDWTRFEDDFEDDIIGYAPAKDQPVFSDWFGGENPAPGKRVEVIFRFSGHVHQCQAETFDWSHEGDDNDIVRYRVMPNQ